MARRNFVVELDVMIRERSVAALTKRPAEPNLLLQEAGLVQGLLAAQLLFNAILQSNLKDEDTR